MEAVVFLLVIIQAIFILYPVFSLWKLISHKPLRHEIIIPIYEVLISILMIFCFWNYDMHESPFRNEEYIFELAVISFTSLAMYFINKFIPKKQNRIIKSFSIAFVGALWWISLLTTLKFFPLILLSIFPVLGLLLAAPFLLFIISSIEIIRIKRQEESFTYIKILSLGLIVLILFQLLMNIWTVDSWEFFKIFKSNHNALYF